MTNRQPKGTPVGGQFAEGRKPEGADLAFVNPDFSVRNEGASAVVLTPEQEEVAAAYKVAALWSTSGDDDEPLDAEYGIDQISEESNEEIAKDVVEFWERAKAEGLTEHWTPGQFGHDFYLTRAGHGAGFWDRGFGYAGGRLTEMAKSYKEKTPIVGDDGSIYFE
jgi:hypothetical protein